MAELRVAPYKSSSTGNKWQVWGRILYHAKTKMPEVELRKRTIIILYQSKTICQKWSSKEYVATLRVMETPKRNKQDYKHWSNASSIHGIKVIKPNGQTKEAAEVVDREGESNKMQLANLYLLFSNSHYKQNNQSISIVNFETRNYKNTTP